MYKEVSKIVKEVFSEASYIPYLRRAENIPLSSQYFVSLYLISSQIEHNGKVKANYQILYGKRIKDLDEESLESFEKEVRQKVKKILQKLPCGVGEIEFGISDAYLYAYIKFSLRSST